MTKKLTAVVFMLLVPVSEGQQLEIEAFDHTGHLSWTAPSNSVCAVEWASQLAPTSDWHRDWASLQDVQCTGTATKVQVPVFYRVRSWTNGLFVSVRPGRTYVYSVSNAVGQTWTQEVSCLGYLAGAGLTNGTTYVLRERALFEGNAPGGLDIDAWTLLACADRAAYSIRPDVNSNQLWGLIAPVGTSWTNGVDEDGDTTAVTIETNETVTVPAGTFGDCLRYKEFDINQPPGQDPPRSTFYYWIKPGFFQVKFVDYWCPQPETYAPVVSVLQSWRDE